MKPDGREVVYAWVGYRIYTPEGDKEDEKGKFQGYGSRYNDWVKIYSPRIQKIHTRSGRSGLEEDFDDIMDSQIAGEGGKQIYCIPRRRYCTSTVMIELYNDFGERGGFQKILTTIGNKEKQTSLEMLFYYMDILSKTFGSLHKNFAETFVPQLKEAVSSCILNAPAQSLRDIRKERIDGIIRSLDSLLKRVCKKEDREKQINVLKLDFALLCVKSPFLERRIQGIKEISGLIKDVRVYGSKSFSPEFLVEWIRANNVFEFIFSAKHCHIQLVQRTSDLMKLFISTNQLTKEEMDMFWGCSKFDDHIKLEIYKVLSDISYNMKIEQLNYFLDAIAASSPEKLIPEEVKCLFDMGQFANDFSFYQKICDLLWILALGAKGYSDEIVNLSRAKYVDLTRKLSSKQKLDILIKLLAGFRDNEQSVQRIKLFTEMLKEKNDRSVISNSYSNVGEGEEEKKEAVLTTQEMFYVLMNENQLIETFYANFTQFYAQLNELVTSGTVTPPLAKHKVFGRYTHEDEIKERLDFLKFIATNSIYKIQKTDFNKLWDLVSKSSKDPADEQQLFKWFKDSCDTQTASNAIIDLNEVGEFFQEKMNNKEVNVSALSLEGFDCLQSYFLLKNEKEGNVLRQKAELQEKRPFSNFSNIQGPGYGTFNFLRIRRNVPKLPSIEETSVKFKVYKDPATLAGLDLMWSIALQCETEAVQAKSIDFLIQVYHNLSADLDDIKMQIDEDFLNTCFAKLKAIQADETIEKSVQQTMICRLIDIIKQLIYESERNGTAGLRPHGALLRGQLLEGIKVKNNIKITRNTSVIELQLYSNTTIWELKKEVARLTDLSAMYVRLSRHGEEIDDVNNGKTLYDLKFAHGETLVANKKSADDIPEAPLLNSENNLTPEAKRIFREWFAEYSTDGFMNTQQCADFIKSCTGEPVRATDDRISGLFKQYDHNTDGFLEEDAFLEFYQSSARTKQSTVRDNLRAHNVRNDLKKLSEISAEGDMNKDDMPRYKISRNQSQFTLLFTLLDRKDQTSVTTWDLINMLVTNPDLYKRTLTIDVSQGPVDWA